MGRTVVDCGDHPEGQAEPVQSQTQPPTRPLLEETLEDKPGIEETKMFVKEVVAVTLRHINSMLHGQAQCRSSEETLLSKKLDVEFFKDDGPLPPGPLRYKDRVSYMRRYGRNPPPDEEPMGERRAILMVNHRNWQPLIQNSNVCQVTINELLLKRVIEKSNG
ncbi:hypothetical protein QAD02_013246 [Eretmocerus hayati]|uniref:Uncharacterized protein n=1 Tax=Eretmocerus hayati TaxID=131215 RepID=A0ACC2P2D0_9HYME|nr:hypothetical protein QAD02_013246 [Eretmocerus hayati]